MPQSHPSLGFFEQQEKHQLLLPSARKQVAGVDVGFDVKVAECSPILAGQQASLPKNSQPSCPLVSSFLLQSAGKPALNALCTRKTGDMLGRTKEAAQRRQLQDTRVLK